MTKKDDSQSHFPLIFKSPFKKVVLTATDNWASPHTNAVKRETRSGLVIEEYLQRIDMTLAAFSGQCAHNVLVAKKARSFQYGVYLEGIKALIFLVRGN